MRQGPWLLDADQRLTDHRLKNIVDHLVELVEKKAAEIEAAKRQEREASLAAAGSDN
jgi:hypothetical protein